MHYIFLLSVGGAFLKGIIKRILENDFGQEFGFIEAEGTDYYFDNRYLTEGTMADLYEYDTVEFIPSTNQHKPSQLVANSVKLVSNKIVNLAESPKDINEGLANQSTDYYAPYQEESEKHNWYYHGKSEKLDLRGFSKREETIIKKMANVLYNSNSGHFKARSKNMLYGYALFGPTKNFVVQLGLEKVEFALILCNKNEFQRRTLEEAFSALSNRVIKKVRISGHFYLLATEYKEIVSQLEKPEIQGSLQNSVIPFSYDELIEADIESFEHFLLSRFKKFLFERNFFAYAEPIKDRIFMFGGREQYAKGIADRSISGDHSGIFGLRKSGKTSVVNMVIQELEQRRILFVNYRCVEFARHNWYQALKKIIIDVSRKVNIEPPKHEYTELNAIELFNDDLKCLLSKKEYDKMILIFDEIEQITFDSTFDEKWQDIISFHLFWSAIITFCEKIPGKLSLVIAGINPTISDVDFLPAPNDKAAPRNPMYKKLSNDNFLIPFVYEQTKRMVNELGKYMGLKFDDEVCYELQKDFGGHPYFTRQMCKTVVNHIRNNSLRDYDSPTFNVTRPLYDAVKESGVFTLESNQWCKDILKELRAFYPDEYRMLLNISNRDITTLSHVKDSPSIIPHLIGYGLIRIDAPSKEMIVAIDIVREYLINEKEYKKRFAEMNKKEIDDEIQDGISEVEQPIRNLIRDVVTTQFTPMDAEQFIKKCPKYSADNKWKNLNGLTISQLLDPRMVILHFNTLKEIICCSNNNFDKFKNKLYPYTKAEIQSYMDNLYVARNAADHHFEVHNEATLINFRSSLSEIKKLLRNLGYIN